MGAFRDRLLSRERGGRSSEQRLEEVLKISLKLPMRHFGRFFCPLDLQRDTKEERQILYRIRIQIREKFQRLE